MKKYILVSKNPVSGDFTMYESNDYRFIYKKYNQWKNILPKSCFCIYTLVESVN